MQDKWIIGIAVAAVIFAAAAVSYYLVHSPELLPRVETKPRTTPTVHSDAPARPAAALYAQHCSACHGPTGEGGIGSSLRNGKWHYSDGSVRGIAVVIRSGLPTKGMPPWHGRISAAELQALAAYVQSLSQAANSVDPAQ